MDELPCVQSRVGHFLKQVLPFAFRSFRQRLGQENITLNDAIGALAVLDPDLFELESMSADVETEGELTRGLLVLDQRRDSNAQPNVEVATSLRIDAARQQLIDRLVVAGNRSR
jgi:inosine-uridine nucleoside N-ribohydrolase